MNLRAMLTVVAVAAIALGSNLRAAETLAAVKEGKPLAVRYGIGIWKPVADGLQSPKECRCLYAGKDLGPGDFRILARLALERMEGTAASFTLNDSHLLFDARGNKLAIEGPLFAGRKLLPAAATLQIKPGQAFDLEIVREQGNTRFLIDRQEILRMNNWDGPASQIGLRPHRNRMTLEQFEIQGNLVVPPMPFGQPVFTSGQDGYYGYRIPALAVTPQGTVLAICEGRKKSFSDAGDIDLVCKRSTDNGKTWSPMQVICDDGGNTCGNPCIVVDRESKTLWLATCRNNDRVFIIHSDDDGLTWSKPAEITSDVKSKEWNWYASGPGSGIQIENGPHKGRLIIPCDHIEKESKKYFSHVIYSDDHGKSWKLGGTTPKDQVNECELVELADGRLLLNMRNYGGHNQRQVAFSDDGGLTWKDQRFDQGLIEPVCQAAIERYRWPSQDKPGVIVFSNPANTTRKGMMVKASFDEGQTWPVARLLHAGPSAYSDLAVLANGEIGCLYEGGTDYDVQYMMFASLPLESLAPTAIPFAKLDPSQPKRIAIPTIDLSQEANRQVVVDKDPARYFGHPSTLLMPDGKTMYCAYALGHAGPPLYCKVSHDGGLTWDPGYLPTPAGADKLRNCPFLHRLQGPDGTWRLFRFVGGGDANGANSWQSYSLDDGKTWTPFANNGMQSVVHSPTIVPVENGAKYLCWYHTYPVGLPRSPKLLEIRQSASTDGGLTWGDTRIVCRVEQAAPCEPAVIRSPDGKQLLMLMRENARRLNSLMMTSDDEGKTWSAPRELPSALAGDRHQPKYAPDGRLVITFRDVATESPSNTHFVAWVGTYDDLVKGREGQYRIKLIHSHAGWDCGYSGLEVLPDGTFVATTYIKHQPGEKNAIVSVRFKLVETDALAKNGKPLPALPAAR
jgi:hypothetical protein